MKGAEMIKLSLSEAVENIKNGSFSARELLDETLKHVESVNYNAILSVCKKEAQDAAAKIDGAIARGETTGVLAGIPVIIKDNIDMAGYASACGSAAFRNNIAAADADTVKKLKDAGAVIIGRANMDEFAMGSSNMTSAFGPVKNPLDGRRVPGGSSGGSACAVASFQCFAALGSDTGGSIRQPASYCGITGLKPTYGSISGDGCFPLAPSMDQIGPLTRTVGDCAAVFGVLAGGKNSRFNSDFLDVKPAPKRIAIIKESLHEIRGDALTAFNAALDKLKACGCTVSEVSVPSFISAHFIYKTVAFSEITQSLRAVKEGRVLLGREVKKRIIAGRYVLDNPYLLEEGQKLRAKLTSEMNDALSRADIILLPSAPSVAFRIDDNPLSPEIVSSDVFAQPSSIAGLPSLSVPFFKNVQGLPLGIQLVGRAWREIDVFALGKLLADEK